MFDRLDPNILYSTSRPKYAIQTWDVRYPTVPTRTYTRMATSNQRLGFDLDYGGKWLAAGDANGEIAVYDLKSASEEAFFTFKGHRDVVGSVKFNTFAPTLLTASGSRHFGVDEGAAPSTATGAGQGQESGSVSEPQRIVVDSSDSISEEEEEEPSPSNPYLRRSQHLLPSPDATLKIWNFMPERPV